MILFILPVRPAVFLHPISRIKYGLVTTGRKTVRHNQRCIILELIIHVHPGRNPRNFAVGSILPECRAAVILKCIRILRHPFVVPDVADLVPEHIPAGIDHRVVAVGLNNRAKRIDQLLKLRLGHILMAGRLHIKNHRVAHCVVSDPLHQLVRFSPRLLRIGRIRIQVYSRPQTGRIGAAHVRIKVGVNT